MTEPHPVDDAFARCLALVTIAQGEVDGRLNDYTREVRDALRVHDGAMLIMSMTVLVGQLLHRLQEGTGATPVETLQEIAAQHARDVAEGEDEPPG